MGHDNDELNNDISESPIHENTASSDDEIGKAKRSTTEDKYKFSIGEYLSIVKEWIVERFNLSGQKSSSIKYVNDAENDPEIVNAKEKKFAEDVLNDSTEVQRKKRERSVRRRIVSLAVLIPLAILAIVIVVKSIINYKEAVKQDRRNKEIAKQMHEKNRKNIGMNQAEEAWKIRQSQKITDNKVFIEGINSNIQAFIKSSKTEQKEFHDTVLKEIKTITRESSIELRNQQKTIDKALKKVEDSTERNFESFKREFVRTINKKIDSRLDDIKVTVEQKPREEGVDYLPLDPRRVLNGGSDEEAELIDVNEIEEITFTDDAGSTLEFLEAMEENNTSVLDFILRAGFAKARIMNGVDAPTFEFGAKNPEPIFLSLLSPISISNGFIEEITDCLLIGTVTGRFGTGRAEIRLSKLECTIEADDGTLYAVNEKVFGWVFGEDGHHAPKGRTITKDGEIISKALPLGLLESMVGALQQSPQLLVPGSVSTGTTGTQSLQQGAIQGFSTGSTKIIEKLGEHFIEYLNSLDPTIEIRAGRLVTVGFKGGEVIKVTPYESVNIGGFTQVSKLEEKIGESQNK